MKRLQDDKTCQILPKVAKYCQKLSKKAKLPKVGKCCQLWQKVFKSCQMLPNIDKSWQILLKVVKNCRLLPNMAKSCQMLPKVVKICQKFPPVGKRCQKLPKVGNLTWCHDDKKLWNDDVRTQFCMTSWSNQVPSPVFALKFQANVITWIQLHFDCHQSWW